MHNVVLVLQPSTQTINDKSTPFDVMASFSHYRLIMKGELKITWTVRIIWPDPHFETQEVLKLCVSSKPHNLFKYVDHKPMVATKGEVLIAATAEVDSEVATTGVEYPYSISIHVEEISGLHRHKIDPILIISG